MRQNATLCGYGLIQTKEIKISARVRNGQLGKAMLFSNKCLHLTHYQTTNFTLFQTERVCRQQFQI